MIQKLWEGVSLEAYNKWHPLTGQINETPEKYIRTWPDKEIWFETFAIRAQNDINAYLNFVLSTFDFDAFLDNQIKETLVDMVFVCVEHWVYNRTPIEFNSDASVLFNNSQTQINSFAIPTVNIWDLHPSRMKILANLTQLKEIIEGWKEEEVDPTLIDLNQFYTKKQTDELLANKSNKSEIPDTSALETKEEHTADITKLQTNIDLKADKNYTDTTFATKTELANELNNKQDKGNYVIADELSSIAEKYNNKYQIKEDATILSGQGDKSRLNTWIDSKATKSDLNTKQDKLISSTNIKTINGVSILGQGDMVITSSTSWIEGEYKWMPVTVTEMPAGWKKVEITKGYTLIQGDKEGLEKGNVIIHKHTLASKVENSIGIAIACSNVEKVKVGSVNGSITPGDHIYTYCMIDNNDSKTLWRSINESDDFGNDSNLTAGLNAQLWQYDPTGKFEKEREENNELK